MYQIPSLPLQQEVETKAVLKQVAQAHRRLAELKGAVQSIPNTAILINTLSLQEAKDSSKTKASTTVCCKVSERMLINGQTGYFPKCKWDVTISI